MDTLSNVSGGVWVFSESKQTVFELLGGGRTLAGASGAPLISMVIGTEDDARECIAYGADQVFLLPVSDQSPLEAYAGTISELAKSYKPELLMIGATNRGKTLAAMIAGDLASGCSTDCKEIARDETGRITVKRLIFGGAGVVTEINGAGPFVVTVGARSYRPLVKDDSRKGVIHHTPCDFATYPVRVVKHLQKTRSAVDVTAADTLVVVGRGLAKQEDMALIDQLAEAVGGTVGCTRPISEDRYWLPTDQYIGLSGKKTKPKLCFIIGCAGQLQLMVGVTDAKIIFVINKDEKAAAFEYADYGIVGDLYSLVPALTDSFKNLKKS